MGRNVIAITTAGGFLQYFPFFFSFWRRLFYFRNARGREIDRRELKGGNRLRRRFSTFVISYEFTVIKFNLF